MAKSDKKKATKSKKSSADMPAVKRKITKGASTRRANKSAEAAAPLRRSARIHRNLAVSMTPNSVLDDESLLKALADDAVELYKAIDSEESKIVANALRDTQEEDIAGGMKLLGAEPPGAEATIYMVSNRKEYKRSRPTRFGVREVTVNTSNRHVQIGQVEINQVPVVEGENLLLFVHGFNNTVNDAALAAWKLSNNLQGIDKAVFFSWPSVAGGVTTYWEDYKIANASVPFVVDCINQLSRDRPGKVHIVAHSMGCRLLMMSLIHYMKVTNPAKLGQVYFIAGDVDQDVFRLAMERLGGEQVATNLNNIASDYDDALIGSKYFMHWKNRCGLYDPIVFSPFDPPSFMSLLRPYPGKGNSHSYYNAANIRADISNQVILHHTDVVPKPVDIRSGYKAPPDTQNALILSA